MKEPFDFKKYIESVVIVLILKKYFLIACGFTCLGLGTIGIFLPLIPTTPFILLAAACFGGSSQKLSLWLEQTKYFGDFIKNYKTGCGVNKKIKIRAIAYLWISLSISIYFVPIVYVKVFLVLMGICVTAHITTIKSKRRNLV